MLDWISAGEDELGRDEAMMLVTIRPDKIRQN